MKIKNITKCIAREKNMSYYRENKRNVGSAVEAFPIFVFKKEKKYKSERGKI